jgi:uncharacterized protein
MSQIEEIKLAQKQLLRGLKAMPARKLLSDIDWTDRLIGIIGAKGVGKTTLMLQRAMSQDDALYCSLDHPTLANCSLIELATEFSNLGGEFLYLDEVHKYDDWSGHIKAIYDQFPNLRVVFSGSSALPLHKGRGDLSRRASMYKLSTLSFREFLQIELGRPLEVYSLDQVCRSHEELASELCAMFKPLKYFGEYLKTGAYPFYQEGKAMYHNKLISVVAQVIESDLVQINNLEGRYVNKLKKLLDTIATSVPFVPNMVTLSSSTGISRPTLYQYLEYLEQGGLIHLVRPRGRGHEILTKAEKIFLDNPNLAYALAPSRIEIGALRESFMVNQLRAAGLGVEAAVKGDFIVEDRLTFEVGGKGKGGEQVAGIHNVFVVSDSIEVGVGRRIPLWLFGFLY